MWQSQSFRQQDSNVHNSGLGQNRVSAIARHAQTPVFPAWYETQLQPDRCESLLEFSDAEQVYQLRDESS